ncbi:unnamed protein product [Oreochromis niloticus]|nr:unnamed protein product [Mustela putorius furo]
MSLADFAALCRLVSGPNEGKDVLPLLNQLGFVQRRKNDKPAIIRYYHCSQEKDPEQYYGRLLRLYLPHRSEQELKPQGFQTYQSFYNSGFVRLPCSDHSESVKRVVKRNKDKYEKNSEDIESALEEFEQNRDVVIDEWCNLAPESEVVRLQCDENLPERHSDDENEQENVPDYNRQSDAVTEIRAVREQPAVDPAVAVTAPEECPIEVLHIYATNKNVESHNTDTLKKLHSNIIIITADDFQKDKCTGRMARRDKPFTGGRNDLPDTLNVAEGARVMLTRNLDTLNGLVNGAFGILVKVVRSENDGHIIKLGLRMDNRQSVRSNRSANAASDDLVYIERAEESLKFKGAVRRQFPVKLAFACTIHKTQGLTTQTAVVSMKNIFEPGMAYVALSRVTSLSGLYLQDLDEKKIYANPEVTAALQTMRQASVEEMMPLLQSLTSKAPLLQTVFIWTATQCSNATDMCPTQTFLTWPAEVVVELLCI